MYKFMNNPYGPCMEADKGGGAGGSGADDGGDSTGGDSQDGEDPNEGGEEDDQEEKKFSQKDIDDAVKKRLNREKRKWQREQKTPPAGTSQDDRDREEGGDSEAEKKARKAEERAAALELKWTCLEHDVAKGSVDDVLALAKVHMAKDDDMDIEDAIDKVLKKYPQFEEGYEAAGGEDGQEKKGWGQRHGRPPAKATTVEDEIRKQMFGK